MGGRKTQVEVLLLVLLNKNKKRGGGGGGKGFSYGEGVWGGGTIGFEVVLAYPEVLALKG